MKKFLKFFSAAVFTLFLFTAPVDTFATVNTTNDDSSITSQTRYISNHLVVYTGYHVPPSTYSYNQNGWRGTLRVTSWQSTGTHLLAYYSGYVTYCSGTCPIQ